MRKVILVLSLFLVLAVEGPAIAKKVVPAVVKGTHFLSYDSGKMNFVPFDNDKPLQVFVIGPTGIEPGVAVAVSKDGTKVLILPEDMADDVQGADPTPAPQSYSHSNTDPSPAPKSVPPDQYKYGQSLTSY